MIKTLLSRLLPREDKFYRLIERLSAETRECALYLKAFLESSDEAHASALLSVKKCRAESKRLSAEITKELCFTFVTPFDREDIQDFATSLYKITKTIEKICERLNMHGLSGYQKDFLPQTDLIIQEAEAMKEMVKELIIGHDNKRIVEKVEVLHKLENRGDIVLGELLVSLFKEHRDAKDLILRKDIYDMLEKVIDRYRDAAAVALQIVLKHS